MISFDQLINNNFVLDYNYKIVFIFTQFVFKDIYFS